MKSTLILSTIALAVLSASSAAPATPSSQWCDAFYAGCKQAALSVCGGNNTSNAKCYAEFSGSICKAVNLSCNCTVTGGATFGAIGPALKNTFAATGGVCSNLDFSNPDTPSAPIAPPPTNAPTPPPTGVPTLNPTLVPTAASSAVATPSVPAPGPSTSTTPKSGAAKTKAGAVAMVAALAGAALVVL